MNNSYDREYVMDTEALLPAIKLLLLESGQTIIAGVTTNLEGDTYNLVDPRVVMIQSARSTEDGEGTETTVQYTDWMPLASSREFSLSARYVVLVTEPIETLVESYERARANG